jgi:hypothetical protein
VVWLGRPVLSFPPALLREGRSIFWEVIVSVILIKKRYTNMCPMANGLRGGASWRGGGPSRAGGMENTGTPSQPTIQSNGTISETVRNRTHVLMEILFRMTDIMTSQNIDLPSRNRAGGKDNTWRPSQTTKMALSRKRFGIGHMFI